MSENKKQDGFVKAVSMADEAHKEALSEEREYRKQIAYTTQDMIDRLDQQKLRDIEMEFMRKATREELMDSVRKLDNHAICSGNVCCPKDQPVIIVKEKEGDCSKCQDVVPQPVAVGKEQQEEKVIHGEDCHCSKCCPNPNPNWIQKHKTGILVAVMFLCMLILSIGWMPSGAQSEALQKAYVDLIVNLPKMSLLFIAGFAAYRLTKKDR